MKMFINSKIFKAVKAKCLDCSGNSVTNVKECPAKDCSLWPYRFGEQPNLFPNKTFESTIKDIKDKSLASEGETKGEPEG